MTLNYMNYTIVIFLDLRLQSLSVRSFSRAISRGPMAKHGRLVTQPHAHIQHTPYPGLSRVATQAALGVTM